MEVRSLFVSGEWAGLVGWCYSIAIATMAYILVQSDLFAEFPDYVACITR